MEGVISNATQIVVNSAGKIILALILLIVGRIVIKSVLKFMTANAVISKMEQTIRSFFLSFVKIGLYVLLIITIIGVLGVPMASVVTVLASAGLAVGMALQGALSNLAGGIMVMFFKPFVVGDYILAAGTEGTVKEVTLFYTILTSVDNKKITIPNGSLMNANVVNVSTEENRRVDLSFSVAKSEVPSKITDLMLECAGKNEKILKDPAPFARLLGGTNESMDFTVRAWCKNADYWDVYFDLTQSITEAMAQQGVKAPSVRVISETK